MRAYKAVVVAVYGGAFIAYVARGNVIPLCDRAVHNNSLGRGQLLTLRRTLVAADVGAELQVIGIQVTIAVRLDIAAMLAIVLVNHGKLGGVVVAQPRLVELTHNPLVPTRNEHDVGTNVQGAFPLLLHVVAILVGLLVQQLVTEFLGVAASKGFLVVKVGANAILVGVLTHTNRHHLARAVWTRAVLMLRSDLQPSPMVRSGGTAAVAGLTGAEGEEVADLVQHLGLLLAAALFGERFGVTHNHRFAVQHIPKVGVKTGRVQILIQRAQHIISGLHGTEVEHKRHLGGVNAVLAHLAHLFKQGLVSHTPKQRAVGAVKEQKINACVVQHRHMVTNDIGVNVLIEAVQRLVPEALERTFAPCGVILAVLGSRELVKHVHNVHGTQLQRVLLMPGPVEDTHLSVILGTHILNRGHRSAQHIHRLPGVRVDLADRAVGYGGVGNLLISGRV